MFWNSYSLFILSLSVFVLAIIYIYLFKKTREKYIGYWSFSWIIYGIAIISDVLMLKGYSIISTIILKQLIYSISSILLLYGTHLFMNYKFSKKWVYFISVNLIWTILSYKLNFPLTIVTILTSSFISIISIYTGIMFLQYWQIEGKEKIVTGVMFLVWGIHQGYYFYLNPYSYNSTYGYLTEVILIILLNACLIIIYLQKNRAEIIRNEKIFRLLTENSQDLIYLYKFYPNSSFEYISTASYKITGYTAEEFYNNPNLFHELIHPDDRPLLTELLKQHLPNKDTVVLRYKHKNGHYIWTEQYTTPIYDKQGNLFGIESVIKDITEKKTIEDKMIMLEKSKQKLRSNISHELKTPITTIRGFSEAIIDDKITNINDIKKYIKIIRDKTYLMERLINDLFEISQLESNQISFNFSQITINELISKIYEKYLYELKHAELNFKLNMKEIHNKKIEIIIDIERIEQVFDNLIYNSIKYTKPGDEININVGLYENKNEYLLIQVSDNGQGISKDDLPYIFGYGYRGKYFDNKKGSGLGLAIVKEIIQKHEGTIWVNSKINEGTTFYFTLPIEYYSEN